MPTTSFDALEYLFSYGTLRMPAVQLATFGRLLQGHADTLPGYRLDQLEIRDAAVIGISGMTHHPTVVATGNPADSVSGNVFAITADELAQADDYEVEDYRRDRVRLASGELAWVYADARVPPPPPIA